MGKSIKYGLIGFAMGAAVMGLQAARAGAAAGPVQVTPGQWQLTETDGPGVRSVCVADPGALLQLQQPGAHCAQFVLDSGPRAMTVHYTCTGRGYGRSTLTVRSPRSIRLETQGVATGAPFNADYDGRFVGPCAQSTR